MTEAEGLVATQTPQVISDDDAAFFASEGFTIPEQGLDEESFAGFRAAIEDVLARNPAMCDVAVVPYIPYRGLPTEGLVGGEQLFRFAVHPTILGAVRKLLGPDVLLWGGEILVKQPGGKASDWHQDCVVATLRPGAGREEPRGVNVWIALDDVDTENSCLRFVPGTSSLGRLDHNLDLKDPTKMDSFPFSPDTSGMRLDDAVDGVFPGGHFSIHDLYVVHGSNPNVSGRRRVAMSLRYLDANDAFDRNHATVLGNAVWMRAGRPIWLVCGENRNEKNNFMIGHEGLEELDRLAEESRQRLNARAV